MVENKRFKIVDSNIIENGKFIKDKNVIKLPYNGTCHKYTSNEAPPNKLEYLLLYCLILANKTTIPGPIKNKKLLSWNILP